MPDASSLTQAQLDAVTYRASMTAKDEVDARFDALEKKALLVGGALLVLWLVTRKRR